MCLCVCVCVALLPVWKCNLEWRSLTASTVCLEIRLFEFNPLAHTHTQKMTLKNVTEPPFRSLSALTHVLEHHQSERIRWEERESRAYGRETSSSHGQVAFRVPAGPWAVAWYNQRQRKSCMHTFLLTDGKTRTAHWIINFTERAPTHVFSLCHTALAH